MFTVYQFVCITLHTDLTVWSLSQRTVYGRGGVHGVYQYMGRGRGGVCISIWEGRGGVCISV